MKGAATGLRKTTTTTEAMYCAVRMQKLNKSETEGRSNKTAEDDGNDSEGVRREDVGGRNGVEWV